MRVYHAIYRLDFLRNYAMMDHPGSVAKLVETGGSPDFFDMYGEDRNARRLMAKRLLKEEKRFRTITVEPTAIVCEFERADGVAIDTLTEDRDFVRLCSIANSVLTEFNILKLERAGLRLFLLGKNCESAKDAVRACRALLKPAVIGEAEEILGAITDVGFGIDGASDANISYHLKFGPYIGLQESGKYFGSINELLSTDFTADTVMDLDLYENKFAFTTFKVLEWCIPHLSLAGKVATTVAKAIVQEAKK